MISEIDDFLDAVKAALIDEAGGVDELTDANVLVWHQGGADPTEDIARGVKKCAGISTLIYDMGGDSDPDDAASPVILSKCAIELFVDPTKRSLRANPALRKPGQIRDHMMRVLHANATIQDSEHCHMEPQVTGYKPLADPDYVCFRIILVRSILLS